MDSDNDFSRALSKLQVITRNSDWLIALFSPVVIGQRRLLWYWFFDRRLRTALPLTVYCFPSAELLSFFP